MRRSRTIAAAGFVLTILSCAIPARAQAPQDNDQTLHAMRDEMARSKTRLELMIPGTQQPVQPYYVEYRLLDLDVREIVAEFGTLLSSTHTRNRFMDVEARVGSYKLDSSNFVSDDGFRGFIGPTGSVGIDRDYDSLRQDLWIATDQAFKEAVETYSRKQAYLSSLARQSGYRRFFKSRAGTTCRAARLAGLDQPQLGAGSAGLFRGTARVPEHQRIARHVLPRLCHRISADQRRNGNPPEPLLRRHRGGHEYPRQRRRAAQPLLRDLRT